MISRRSFFRACVAPVLSAACALVAPASAETKTLVVRGADVTVNGLQVGPPRYIFIRQGTPAWDAWERVGRMPTVRVNGVAGWWKPALFPPATLRELQAPRPYGSAADCKECAPLASPTSASLDAAGQISALPPVEGPSEGLAR